MGLQLLILNSVRSGSAKLLNISGSDVEYLWIHSTHIESEIWCGCIVAYMVTIVLNIFRSCSSQSCVCLLERPLNSVGLIYISWNMEYSIFSCLYFQAHIHPVALEEASL